MKLCPFCAEEIQDAAIRCKHCRSDLGAGPTVLPHPRDTARRFGRSRLLLVGSVIVGLAVTAAAGPLVARPVLRQLRSDRCEPANLVEWHSAIHRGCLRPSYVCERMTTSSMLDDPDVARSFLGEEQLGSRLAEMVGRMRHAFGCAPEAGPAFQVDPGPVRPPAFPFPQDVPRSL